MDKITFDDFKKVEIKVARVEAAERVEGSDKIIKLTLNLGRFADPDQSENVETNNRTVLAGIGKNYEPESLVGKQIVIVANLLPKKIMGMESDGMILACEDEKGLPVILNPEQGVPNGSIVR